MVVVQVVGVHYHLKAVCFYEFLGVCVHEVAVGLQVYYASFFQEL